MAGDSREAAAAASSFSLSFKSQKGKSSKSAARHEPSQLAGFAETSAAGSKQPRGQLVIPLPQGQAASRGPRAFRADRFLPPKDDGADGTEGDHFELAAPEDKTNVKYGLLQKEAGPSEPGTAQQAAAGAAAQPAADADWMAMRRGKTRQDDAQQLREDLGRLPDSATDAQYEDVPVEAFGEAMLRGMGWTEGMGLGRKVIEIVKAPEYVRRPQGLGLGAQPGKAPEAAKKRKRPGEAAGPKPDLVYIDPKTGLQKNVAPVGAVLTERVRLGVHVGKRMRVCAGRHEGLLCSVLAVDQQADMATVELQPSEQRVRVGTSELQEATLPMQASTSQPEAQQNGHTASVPDHGRAAHGDPTPREDRSKHDRDKAERKDRKHQEKRAKREAKRAKKARRRGHEDGSSPDDEPAAAGLDPGVGGGALSHEPPWLAPHIAVKIVDKHLKGGRLYLKKGVIVDVHSPTACSVYVSDSKDHLPSVQQHQLETVVPRADFARVLILRGSHRYQHARLLKRETDTGQATVQLLSSFEAVQVAFDDVSEFLGDAGEDE